MARRQGCGDGHRPRCGRILHMELNDVMRTTFACREFTDEPVPDDVLYEILDVARFAPTGGNRQGQRVIVVRDRDVRRNRRPVQAADGGVHGPGLAWGVAMEHHRPEPRRSRRGRRGDTAVPISGDLIDVPVLLVICVDLSLVASFDSNLDRVGVVQAARSTRSSTTSCLLRATPATAGSSRRRSQIVNRRPSNSSGCRAISRSRPSCHSAGRSNS